MAHRLPFWHAPVSPPVAPSATVTRALRASFPLTPPSRLARPRTAAPVSPPVSPSATVTRALRASFPLTPPSRLARLGMATSHVLATPPRPPPCSSGFGCRPCCLPSPGSPPVGGAYWGGGVAPEACPPPVGAEDPFCSSLPASCRSRGLAGAAYQVGRSASYLVLSIPSPKPRLRPLTARLRLIARPIAPKNQPIAPRN